MEGPESRDRKHNGMRLKNRDCSDNRCVADVHAESEDDSYSPSSNNLAASSERSRSSLEESGISISSSSSSEAGEPASFPGETSDTSSEETSESAAKVTIFELNCGHTNHSRKLCTDTIARELHERHVDIAVFVEVSTRIKLKQELCTHLREYGGASKYATDLVAFKAKSYKVYMLIMYNIQTIRRLSSDHVPRIHHKRGDVLRMCRWSFVHLARPETPVSIFATHQHKGGGNASIHTANYQQHLEEYISRSFADNSGPSGPEQLLLVGDFNMRPSTLAAHYHLPYRTGSTRFALTDTSHATTPKRRSEKNRPLDAIDNIVVYRGASRIVGGKVLHTDHDTKEHYTGSGKYLDTDTVLGTNHYAIIADVILPSSTC